MTGVAMSSGPGGGLRKGSAGIDSTMTFTTGALDLTYRKR